MTCEPLNDYLTNSDTCYFASYTIDGKAECCISHLYLYISTERHPHCSFEMVCNCPPLDECARKHESSREYACETDTEFIKNDSSKEKEEEIHVHESVCS